MIIKGNENNLTKELKMQDIINYHLDYLNNKLNQLQTELDQCEFRDFQWESLSIQYRKALFLEHVCHLDNMEIDLDLYEGDHYCDSINKHFKTGIECYQYLSKIMTEYHDHVDLYVTTINGDFIHFDYFKIIKNLYWL